MINLTNKANSFFDSQIVILITLIVAGVLLVNFAGNLLAPIIASIVSAYVLDSGIVALERRRVSRTYSLILVYLSFVSFVTLFTLFFVPILAQQMKELLTDLPDIIKRGREILVTLQDMYPQYINDDSRNRFIESLQSNMNELGGNVLALSLASVAGLISLLVYVLFVPLLIYFFLKDKKTILRWVEHLIPGSEKSHLVHRVWQSVHKDSSGYIRGKLFEVLIMWLVHWVAFAILGLKYAPLLSFLVGLSVIIPLLGSIIAAIPIAFVAYTQWGFSEDFVYLVTTYLVLQVLDGNVLVPFLFSEIINLHPLATLCSIFIFGSVWGIGGVFFAIPLAILINSVIKEVTAHRANQGLNSGSG